MPFEARASTKAGGCDERWHPEQGVRAFTFFTGDEKDFRGAAQLLKEKIDILSRDQWQVCQQDEESSGSLARTILAPNLYCTVYAARIFFLKGAGPKLTGESQERRVRGDHNDPIYQGRLPQAGEYVSQHRL